MAKPGLAAFSASLAERTTATKALLSRIVALGPRANSPEVDQLQARCHKASSEVSDLHYAFACGKLASEKV